MNSNHFFHTLSTWLLGALLLLAVGGAAAQLRVNVTLQTLKVESRKQVTFVERDLVRPVDTPPFAVQPEVRYSPGAVRFASSAPAVASVDAESGLVTPHAIGVATITATQARSGVFGTSSDSYRLTVAEAPPNVLRWIDPITRSVTQRGQTALFAAPVSGVKSQGAILYTIDNPDVATVAAEADGRLRLTVLNGGSATITATQAAQGHYAAAAVAVPLTVDRLATQLQLVVPPVTYQPSPLRTLTLSATSDRPGEITYTSANPAVASVVGNTVTVHGAGEVLISAHQAVSGDHAAGLGSDRLVVAKAMPQWTQQVGPQVDTYPFNPHLERFRTLVSSDSPGAIDFDLTENIYQGSPVLGRFGSVGGSGQLRYTMSGRGQAKFIVRQVETANFLARTQTDVPFTVQVAQSFSLSAVVSLSGESPLLGARHVGGVIDVLRCSGKRATYQLRFSTPQSGALSVTPNFSDVVVDSIVNEGPTVQVVTLSIYGNGTGRTTLTVTKGASDDGVFTPETRNYALDVWYSVFNQASYESPACSPPV